MNSVWCHLALYSSWRRISPMALSAWALEGGTLHHAGYVQVFDDQHAVAVDQVSGYLVEGVLAQSPDSPVALVDAALGFPPATGAYCPAGLGPLPAAESSLHLVIGLGVLVSIAIGIGGVWVEAGFHCSLGACISHWSRLGLFPHLDGEVPTAVFTTDVRFVDYALGQCMVQLQRADYGQRDAPLSVVADLGDAAGRLGRSRFR